MSGTHSERVDEGQRGNERRLSRERRARMARIDRFLQESRALRALVDLKYEARLTTQGQIVAAMRRGAL